MSPTEIHEKLAQDEAYLYSRFYNDIENMQMVLRAYKLPCTIPDAKNQIQFKPSSDMKSVDKFPFGNKR